MRLAWLWAVTALFCTCQCDDSLQSALDAITRRQRDLTDDTLYYLDHFRPPPPQTAPAVVLLPHEEGDGQPEDIGYGYQKSFAPKTAGLFESVPVPESEIGTHDPGTQSHISANEKALEDTILDYIEENMGHLKHNHQRFRSHDQNQDSKRSVFRERDVNVSPELLQHLNSDEESPEQIFENGEHPKINPTSFRERFSPKPLKNHRTQNAQSLVRSFGGLNRDEENFPENGDDSDEYLSMLNSVWEKYQGENIENLDPEDLSERDVEEILDHINRKQKRQHDNSYVTGYDFFNSPLAWVKRSNQRISDESKDPFLHALKFLNSHTDTLESMKEEDMTDEEKDDDVAKLLLSDNIALKSQHRQNKRFWRGNTYEEPLAVAKRYPVAKRSSSNYVSPTVFYHKPSTANKLNQRRKKNIGGNHGPNDKTDPKVAQEINDIFSPSENMSKAQNSTKNVQPNITNVVSSVHKLQNHSKQLLDEVVPNNAQNTYTLTKRSGQKEVTGVDAQHKHKKSVDWSDYFGIDKRRKKSVSQPGNDEWLVSQYLKAYSIPAQPLKEPNVNHNENSDYKLDKKSADDMDTKLRAMEDMIVDQTLKFTGAHEGMKDSEEIQAVKDRVIAQLAAAYSLEKMRKALGEFKSSMAAQLASAPAHTTTNAPKDVPEQKNKRVAIKKENAGFTPEARLEKKEQSDNKVHAIYHSSHSHSPASRNPEETCPIMDDMTERCREIAYMAGDTSEALLPLCNLHQVCYLCGSETGVTTRACDSTFLSEANNLCGERSRCRYIAHRTVAAMRSLHGDPSPRGQGCDWQLHPCLAHYLALIYTRR